MSLFPKYRSWRDSLRFDVAIGSRRGDGDMDSDILEAIERARGFKLCPRRIWAVSSSLPEGSRSLPRLIPAPDQLTIPSPKLQHHEHEQCTFDFCEHSRLDYTSVAQHHEDCGGACGFFRFPLDQLIDRVERERGTAWKLVSDSLDDVPSLLDSAKPYLAVSHVWADGTGAGTWGPGKVNKCLYKFFCGIARDFQCEGCWWDSISIPRPDKARNMALNSMHNNYATARVTLVHDLYLREWEWVDAQTACFAIVMSPWYSRGWTALELAKSRKVKILFKARNDRYIIKDLDIDILAKVSESSPYHATADAIRKLRRAKIETFRDLSSILAPRDTSKPRDVSIISGLLAGVDVSGGLSQQELYQQILRKLGNIAQGHLFHRSATMTAPGFSWCPTNILDMPMVETKIKSAQLHLRENGDLEGTWKVYSTRKVNNDNLVWHGTHALTLASLKSALGNQKRSHHILLAETEPKQCKRALLVQPMRREGQPTNTIYCRFVGSVYFHSALGRKEDDHDGHVLSVRINNDNKMQRIEGNAWDYVCEMIDEHNISIDSEAPDTDSGGVASAMNDEDDPGSQDLKALLFIKTNTQATNKQLFQETSMFRPPNSITTSNDMVMYWTPEDSDNPSTSIQGFFYGDKHIIASVEEWLTNSVESAQEMADADETVKTEELMQLFLDKNSEIQVVSSRSSAGDRRLGGNALRIAVENGGNGLPAPLVTLLLDNGAPLVFNDEDKPGKHDNKWQELMHLAAKEGLFKIVDEVIKHMDDFSLNKPDPEGCTALIAAAKNGRVKVVNLLLGKGAATNVADNKHHTALHYAALNNHVACVEALLNYDPDQHKTEAMEQPSSSFDNKRINDETEIEPQGDASDGGNNQTYTSAGQSGVEQTGPQYAQRVDLELQNDEKMTALQLVSKNGHAKVVKLLLDKGASTAVSETPVLQLAAKHGRYEALKELLQHQDYKWKQDELDASLLSAYKRLSIEDDSKGSFKKVIKKLVHHGARSGLKDTHGWMTALDWAIKLKDEDTALSLIEQMEQNDGNLEGKSDNEQQSALVAAVAGGLRSVAKELLAQGAKIETKDSRGRTALHWAAVRGDMELATKLVKSQTDGIYIRLKDDQGRTALHLAAKNGKAMLIELLLEKGAENSQDQDGWYPLTFAAEYGRVDALKALIVQRNDPTKPDHSGKSALDRAAMNGFNDVVEAIFENLEAPVKDEAVEKAFTLAAEGGHLPVSITLHEHIKDSKIRDSTVSNMLFSAATAASTPESAITRLMKMDVNVNHQDKDGQTALMLSVKNKKRFLCEALLVRGADPDKSDLEKRTPLMVAAERLELISLSILLRAKANINLQDDKKYTALHYAAEHGDPGIINIILDETCHKPDTNLQDFRQRTALHIFLEKLPNHYRVLESKFGRYSLAKSTWARRSMKMRFMRTSSLRFLSPDPEAHDSLRMLSPDPEALDSLRSLLKFGTGRGSQDEEKQTPLHWAVRKHRGDMVEALLDCENPVSLDIPDSQGRTPLLLAAERRNSGLVNILVEVYKFKPDSQDKLGRTPLWLAAETGDADSVKVLLKNNAKPNLPDHKSRTALMQAARHGYIHVVNSLIDNQKEEVTSYGFHEREEANRDARDDMGQTALMMAAENGHEAIVAALLDKGADSTFPDYEGKMAWQRAMDKGHAYIVGLLLSRSKEHKEDMMAVNRALLVASRRGWTELVGVLLANDKKADVTFQDDDGWTCLHMAAMGGHYEVMTQLIEKGIEIAVRDKQQRTALILATEHGFKSIVELLLSRPEVKNDIDGWMGPEALRCAAEKDSKDIVNQLLESNVKPIGCDSAGRTALILAAADGNVEIVNLLLNKQAGPNLKDNQDRTALHYAALGGHERVVESLLAWEVDVNASDNGGHGPLHLAAERASESVVQSLLRNGAYTNAKSEDGQTALHRAAWGGSHDTVKLLRKYGADPFLQDCSNNVNKPWQVAAEKGFESIVETLLGDEESVQDALIAQQKALIFASQKGYVAMAQALLNKGAVTTVADNDGQTPLHWAAKRGDYVMLGLLIERDGQNKTLDARDKHQRTPLYLAVQKGQGTVVRILLEKGANPNILGQEGRTVLHVAAEEGNSEIVRILYKRVDPHVRDSQRQKAWLLAATAGHHHIAELLLGQEVNFNPESQTVQDLFLDMASKGFVLIVKLLLQYGVDKDAADQLGKSAIGIAAEKEKADVVNLLLEEEADIDAADSDRQTPLLWAAKTGNQKIMKLLLDKISRVAIVSDGQGRPSTASKTGNQTIIRLLFNKISGVATVSDGQDRPSTASKILNHTDSLGRAALLVATQNNRSEVVKLLLNDNLKNHIDVNLEDRTKRTALHFAAETGNSDVLRLLLDRGANQKIQDVLKRTALFLAVNYDHYKAVEVLLEASTDALEIPDCHQRTILQVAAGKGNSNMTRILLKYQAGTDFEDSLKRTALSLAVENGHKEVVDLLLEKGARQNLPDGDKRSPISLAIANGDKSMVKALFDHRKPALDTTSDGPRWSLLEIAVQSRSEQVTWLVAERMVHDLRQPR